MENIQDVFNDFILTAQDFINKPYVFFREADVVAHLTSLLYQRLKENDKSKINSFTGRIHLEYPANYFINDKTGRFDLAILSPRAIEIAAGGNLKEQTNDSQIMYNLSRPEKKERKIKDVLDKLINDNQKSKLFSLLAEFKMCYKSLSIDRLQKIKNDIKRLNNLMDYSEEIIFHCLIRQRENVTIQKEKLFLQLLEAFSCNFNANCKVVCGLYVESQKFLDKFINNKEQEFPSLKIIKKNSGFIITTKGNTTF
jgi:hypothetical protein